MTVHFSFPEHKKTKVGDKVRIVDLKWVRNGQEGIVAEVSKRGIYIKFKDEKEPIFFPGHYEIIESK